VALMEEVQSYRRRIKQLEDDLLFRLSNSQASPSLNSHRTT
jgi:dynein heavy chain